jgi:hypothetical protein
LVFSLSKTVGLFGDVETYVSVEPSRVRWIIIWVCK